MVSLFSRDKKEFQNKLSLKQLVSAFVGEGWGGGELGGGGWGGSSGALGQATKAFDLR